MKNRLWLTCTVLASVLALWSVGAQAQDKPAADNAPSPATMAPADAAIYLEVRNLTQLHKQFEQDPLTALLREQLPMARQPKEWAQVQAIMGMRSPELIERYLGTTAALVLEAAHDGAPGAVITRVSPDDARYMANALDMRPAGSVGNVPIQQTRDAKLQTAYHNSWLAFTGGEHKVYLENLLTTAAKGDTLAASELFKAWTDRLPGDRQVTLFARPNMPDAGIHAASLHRDTAGMSMHYVGEMPKLKEQIFTIANEGNVAWGPLPETTVAAMTLNVERDTPGNPLLDRLVMPKSFANDVRPHIGAPAIVFLGEVPGSQTKPAVDFHVPALGVAIHMSDPAVAADLDIMFDRLMIWANVATANWGVAQISLDKHEGYQVADLGTPLSQRTGRHELKPVRLTAGAIGEWYVICTQDEFFKACQATQKGGRTFADVVASQAADGMPAGNVVAAMHVNAERLSTHLGTWVKHWEATDPTLFSDGKPSADAPRRWRDEAQLARWVKLASEVAGYYKAVDMQAVRNSETEVEAGMAMQRQQ